MDEHVKRTITLMHASYAPLDSSLLLKCSVVWRRLSASGVFSYLLKSHAVALIYICSGATWYPEHITPVGIHWFCENNFNQIDMFYFWRQSAPVAQIKCSARVSQKSWTCCYMAIRWPPMLTQPCLRQKLLWRAYRSATKERTPVCNSGTSRSR